METEHKNKLRKRMQKEGKDWIVEVRTKAQRVTITSAFNSRDHTFENVLHKIESDLMTNLHYGFIDPIRIRIRGNK